MRFFRSPPGLWMLGGLLALLALMFTGGARAQPATAGGTAAGNPVLVGVYVNKIRDLNFRENKYVIDFYLWFRWKPEGVLAEFKPLDSFEIINGKIEDKGSIVEKRIGDLNYASVRASATMSETWELSRFPFDSHTVRINIEDSALTIPDLVFMPDRSNSGLGDEIDIAGWNALNFMVDVKEKIYRTNYGDISLPTDARSDYSRFVFGNQAAQHRAACDGRGLRGFLREALGSRCALRHGRGFAVRRGRECLYLGFSGARLGRDDRVGQAPHGGPRLHLPHAPDQRPGAEAGGDGTRGTRVQARSLLPGADAAGILRLGSV
jgi:hypothetical protein